MAPADLIFPYHEIIIIMKTVFNPRVCKIVQYFLL